MIKSYFFVKGERTRKKVSLYQLFLSTTLDMTSLLYVGLLFAYSLFAFYQVGQIPDFVKQLFSLIDQFLARPEWLILPILFLPIYFISQSFNRSGVLFSSAEFLLSILPHRRNMLWFLTLIEKLLKLLLILIVVAVGIYSVTSVPISKLSLLILIIFTIMTVMTVVQWKLYQLHISWRMIVIVVAGLLASASALSQNLLVILLYGLFLIGLFIFSLRYLFTRVDWQRVIAASDFDIWNIQLMSIATKIKFQKDAQPSLWYRLEEWKRKFPYEKSFAYHRLWYIYGEKQISIILRVTGAIFLSLTVISYFKQLYFVLVVIVAIHVQTTFLVSLFKDRLYTGLVNILPWDITEFRKTFIHWALLTSLILFIPIGFYTLFYFEKRFIVYIVYAMALFYYTLQVKLQKYVDELTKRDFHLPILEGIGYALFIIFGLGAWYPLLLIVGFAVFIMIYMKLFRHM